MQSKIEDFSALSPLLARYLQAYCENKPYSCLLLHGIEGVGKKTFARILASAMFCEGDKKPCFACPSCSKIAKDEASELLTVRALEKSIKIESIRELLEKLQIHSISASRRLVIIEDADLMTGAAQNALLKSLEEPFDNCFFILTASQLSRVLATIQSRCTKLAFPLWPNEMLEKKAESLGLCASPDLVKLCSGSIGRLIAFSGDQKLKKLSDIAIKIANRSIKLKEFPKISIELGSEKDNARIFLYMLEQAICLLSDSFNAKKLEAVINARKMLDSNVSFQGLIDYMLINFSEDI